MASEAPDQPKRRLGTEAARRNNGGQHDPRRVSLGYGVP